MAVRHELAGGFVPNRKKGPDENEGTGKVSSSEFVSQVHRHGFRKRPANAAEGKELDAKITTPRIQGDEKKKRREYLKNLGTLEKVDDHPEDKR